MPTSALLLIAHGTRDPRGAKEMDQLLALVRQRLDVPVGHAWLEDFVQPQGVEGARPLVGAGATELVALPLLNFAAGHAKYDIPKQVDQIQQAFPELVIHTGEVLGPAPDLLSLAWERLDAVSPPETREDEVLVIAASGSSDPDANGELYKAARMVAEGSGHRWVEPCVAGVTWPRTEQVLQRIAAAGARRAVVFSWSLLAGVLERRIWDAVDEVSASTGLLVAKAGRFGPDPRVADAVVARYHLTVNR
ncbi:MAG: sirohydrochlorin chelatase [Euzebya sp.]